MTVIRWLGVLLVLWGGFFNPAMAARAPAAPAAAAPRGPTGQPPSGQVPETRIAAVVNDDLELRHTFGATHPAVQRGYDGPTPDLT